MPDDRESAFQRTLRGRMLELDGLRGIAMLWVVLYHCWFLEVGTWWQNVLYTVPQLGLIGVEFFFVMSGFLITGILLRYRDSPNYLSGFYGRRVIRTLPLYFFFLAVVYYVIPAVPFLYERFHWFSSENSFEEGRIWHWFFLSNFWYARQGFFDAWYLNPTWSLAIEEQFYLVWPILVLAIPPRFLGRFILCVLAASVSIRVWLLMGDATATTVFVFTPGRLDGIAIGCYLGVVAYSPGGVGSMVRWRRRLAWAGIPLFAFGIVWVWFFHENIRRGQDDLARFLQNPVFLGVGLLGVALCSGSLVAHMLVGREDGVPRRWMRSPFLHFWAKYSYAMYLFHTPGYDVARRLMAGFYYPWRERLLGIPLPELDRPFLRVVHQGEVFLFTLAVTTVFALITWNAFERHFLKLKTVFPYTPKAGSSPPESTKPGAPPPP